MSAKKAQKFRKRMRGRSGKVNADGKRPSRQRLRGRKGSGAVTDNVTGK